jgi:phosphocarrier protein HPr
VRIARGTFRIVNERGLHARAASVFVNVASEFESVIRVEKDGRKVDGRSILGILSLLGVRGSQIEVTAEGDDAEEAIATLRKLVALGFDEGAIR